MKKKLTPKKIEEKYQRPPLAKSEEPKPKLEEKKFSDFKFGIEEKEIEGFGKSFLITISGEKALIRSGLIKAMLADEVFANHITLAAEYFKTIKK